MIIYSSSSSKQISLALLFCFRFDMELVPNFLKNIDFIDGFLSWDDTNNTDLFFHERRTRRKLIDMARSYGVDWF